MVPAFAYEYGVCNYMFSSVMAWDTRKVKGTPTMADFFDLKKIPGKRMIRKDSQAMIEMALIADGVPLDKLYPMDVDRAIAKFATIKDSILTWDTGAQSQSLLRDGEVSMGWLWHTRANAAEAGGRRQDRLELHGGVLQPGLWVVPKRQPGGQAGHDRHRLHAGPGEPGDAAGGAGQRPGQPAGRPAGAGRAGAIDPGYPSNAAMQVRSAPSGIAAIHGATFKRFLDFLSA